MPEKNKILITDDETGILNALRRQLQDQYEIHLAQSGAAALEILKKHSFALVIADQRMPGMKGVELLHQVLEKSPSTTRILMTAYTDMEATIDAVNRGNIFYYLTKPWEENELFLIVERAIEQYRLKRENDRLIKKLTSANMQLSTENLILKENLANEADFSRIITNDPEMLNLFKMAKKALNVNATILIEGETGTGKELLARAIHYNGNRKEKLFVAQNCAALPQALLESELFGHIKGAFTGAVSNKKGLFEAADGGTIFLDEIGDVSPDFQVKLLRILQEGEIRPVGGVQTRKVDVRVIAATNKHLSKLVEENKFREDLFYRLSVFPLKLPPLRQRKKDIPLLVEHFIQKYQNQYDKKIAFIADDALEMLLNYDYPGNIRELENIISRAVILCEENGQVTKELLQLPQSGYRFPLPSSSGNIKKDVRTLETAMIKSSLQKNRWNISKTARELNLTRQGLYKKIKRYGIDAEE